MQTHRHLRPRALLGLLAAAALFLGTSLQLHAQEPVINLLPEGDIIGEAGATPRGWVAPHANWLERVGATIELQNDPDAPGNLVTLTNTKPGQLVRLQSQLEIEPSWIGRTLVFSARLRSTDLTAGPESWHVGGLKFYYSDTADKHRFTPGNLALELPSAQWRRLVGRWKVTADAKLLHIDLGLLGTTGMIQIRDVVIALE